MKRFLTVEISDQRIFGLDILRALAIFFVVFGHGRNLLPEQIHYFYKLIVFDGVAIFFVLSGFLIGGILIKLLDNNKPTQELLFNFWIRRWFRTLPNYFLILFLLIAFSFLYNTGVSIWELKSYFIFSQNLFYRHPSFFPEAWSLSVEEWFYVITPICLFSLIHFFGVKPRKAILLFAFSVLIAALLFRLYRFSITEISSIPEWGLFFRKQVITRLDSLMFGVICAYIQYYAGSAWLKYKKHFLGLGILIFLVERFTIVSDIVPLTGFYGCVLSFSVLSAATAFLLPYLSDLKKGSGLIHSGITLVSLISYSMYLLNLSVVQFNILHKIPWTDLIDNTYAIAIVKYATYWLLTIFGSIILYKYFEIPTTRLRDSAVVKRTVARLFSK